MRCDADVVEIPEWRVIACSLLAEPKKYLLPAGKACKTHIRSAASGALDYVDDHGVVVALTYGRPT